jgi:uncharacterized YigZ family protein
MDVIDDTYKTIETPSEGLFKDKGSKFIAYAYPVSEEEEIKSIIQSLKKEHYSARHHCYAYRLGDKGQTFRVNDDGEPSGTAGRPIYGQILSNNLTNILIVVVRYFGGTLLGVSGLINAYKSAASDVLSNSKIITKIVKEKLNLEFDYIIQNQVMKVIKDYHIETKDLKYGLLCSLDVYIRLGDMEPVTEKFKKIEGLKITSL